MPKPTFSNIAPEKRERVLKEAARLFATRGFAETDMAELAARATVSKGSLYDYFESKEDLYLSVCRDALARSRRAVYGGIKPHWDIYRQIDHIFRKGAAFARANPEYVRMYLNVSASGMEQYADKLTQEVEGYTADHLKALLREGIAEGIVRSDVDVNLAAFLINSIYIVFLASLVSRHYQIRMKEYLEITGRIDARSATEQLDKVILTIERFLKPTQTNISGSHDQGAATNRESLRLR